jgi:hypothetical protein
MMQEAARQKRYHVLRVARELFVELHEGQRLRGVSQGEDGGASHTVGQPVAALRSLEEVGDQVLLSLMAWAVLAPIIELAQRANVSIIEASTPRRVDITVEGRGKVN